VLILAALKLGLERPVAPFLRLLALPCAGLIAGRLAAHEVLASMPGLKHPAELIVAVGVSGAVFAAVVAVAAPQRIREMTLRLHRALRPAPAL
jgi:hypothetical protein